ncbi:MAG: hypothetical protein OXI05_01455 [Bacteroidota bacterium]|nr:hypothetical protein [Bacteroidota bacterium]MXW33807.1 hypothetical protein [Rhodothermaceae bacterium]MXZ18368.1 hypothetical protein [Rhodothermaceae bacterium]MYC03433.1 hypothetical protein [Rhodothermaceae bacterium]MYE63808.1 hypothetical protein [Rhodothermaceae bacterium]
MLIILMVGGDILTGDMDIMVPHGEAIGQDMLVTMVLADHGSGVEGGDHVVAAMGLIGMIFLLVGAMQ